MFNIFKIPESKLDDYHSQSMFMLSYRINSVNAVLFLVLIFLHLKEFDSNLALSVMVFLMSIFSIWYMRKCGDHKLAAKLTTIGGTFFVQFNIYNLLNPDRFVDMIWIIIIVLYSFYAINQLWGMLTLLVNFLGITFYQKILSDIHFKNINELQLQTVLDYYLSVLFGGIMIGYLLILFSKTQSITNLKYRAANKKLRENNKIVKQQNAEKTVMLKEIHHRVKNNLQVITSLLRLQSKDIDDPEVIKQFSEATNRVIAMSLIHEKIYQTDNLSDIDISAYFETLTKELIRSYTVGIPIETNISTNISAITPDHMVPFALLLNELTSNSLKHGFSNVAVGKIEIHLTEKDNNIKLMYQDNGAWNVSEKKFSFGLELIETLTEQLDGTCERQVENGTTYIFTFPKN
ncbi:MAG: sensor histidine kinase [Crocinitomicaceae bacterium]